MSSSNENAIRQTILIIEDDADTRDLLVVAFEAGGYRVLRSSTAEEGLVLLRTQRIAAVVTDYNLPGDTGATLIHRAMNQGLLDPTTTPTMMCTGYAYVQAPRGVSVVLKPIAPQKLVRDVKDALARAAGGEGNPATMVEHRVSGHDFVRAMLLAGYRFIGTTMGHALLAKGDKEVLVPHSEELADGVILALLQRAEMPPLQFIALLNRLGSRDTWADRGTSLPAEPVDGGPSRARR
jgi:CheY-like chemotaxis protein